MNIAAHTHNQPLARKAPAVERCRSTRLTELVVPNAEQHTLLLPMLQYLSNQHKDRWVTIISDKAVSQRWLKEQGVNVNTIRVIQAQHVNDALWMTWEAVANGTSHTVIAELGVQTQTVIRELEQAADEGDCRVVLVRSR
ncbi:SulA-like leucine-rich domain-containing protein [Simiduia curdlanivorans]|uniref:Cell division inhibitor SulA n=1 Tax=Simiduia curdlanivorans TaxID=1492769 RepID=A0ABV8V9J5_9GAMM|nr:SulA-like leucine-rich domain-containing protein [Simiduia curdlanivorans]MDN3639566.1 SulA-like leucine-rich domain-containing protein [Simiduia curdlanivorans]